MNASFIICSLFYSALLFVVYFSKRRLATVENKVYRYLVTANFIGLVIEMLAFFFTINRESFPITTEIINKAYLIYLLTWLMLFMYYTFLVSFKRKINLRFNSKELYKKISGVFFKIYLVVAFALLVLPLYYNSNGVNAVYSYGPSSLLCTVMSSICIIFSLIFMIIGYKDIKKEKFIPLISYTIIFPIVIYVQYKHPEIYLTTPTETFITFLLYFTIENPDINLIEELSREKERAEQNNLAKTKFLHSISHEIRTPLTNIMGFSESLKEKKLDKSAKSDVENIELSANTLLDVVNGILDISKLETSRVELVEKRYNIGSMLEEITMFTKEVMPRRPVEFRTCFDTSMPEALYGDYVILRQIILNLLANSIERTKVGYIEFNVTSVIKNDICRLILSFEDTGGTLSARKLETIFDENKEEITSESLIEGVSTSLSATKKLVKLMGGSIVCQNVYGRGVKITVALDQGVVHLNKETLKELNTTQTANIAGKNILIVDDNKLNIKVASRLLEKYDVNIDSVLSGKECLEKIDNGEKYDLILMDDMMPNMSGVETFKKLKSKKTFTTPTVMLTANAIDGMKEKYLLQDGFDEYIAKPIEKTELERVLNKIFK